MSVDPLTKKYAELTPYQFASNSPIAGIDEDGLEWSYYDKNNKQVNINSSTTNGDKLKIVGKWVGYDTEQVPLSGGSGYPLQVGTELSHNPSPGFSLLSLLHPTMQSVFIDR